MIFSNRHRVVRFHMLAGLFSLVAPVQLDIIRLRIWRVQKGHQLSPSYGMQLELTTGMVIRGQDAAAEFVSKLRLHKGVSTKLQAIIEKELHARIRMGVGGIDGDMVMSEIGIVGKLVLQGSAT